MSGLSSDTLAQLDAHWNRTHWVGRDQAADQPVTAERLWSLLEHPGMHWPYLTLVRASVQPALKDFSTEVPAHRQRRLDPARIRKLVDEGHTLKFQRLEDFDDDVRHRVAAFQNELAMVTTAYAFVTPAESTGLSFHRDASHVVAWQLEGTKKWTVVRPEPGVNPDAGLEPEPRGEHFEFTLSPGDVLYLPHGWPHRATTGEGGSTHLTFTLARPTPSALAAELLARAGTPELSPARNTANAAVERLGL
ncbi:cupin domain-containing protein [Streptomyces sp. NPDC005438]|uniref:JmjC domain-containing protein n=1 Tax=Streptomyces sp. NPDC005438 TaxID=3156880 RepID=UPI0033B21521